jgi:hypothetical protein
MKRMLIIVLFFFSFKILYSCSCAPYSFCETAAQRVNHVVLLGKIIDTVLHSVRIEVIEVLRGTENRDTIIVWDGTDSDCNGPIPMNASGMGNIGDTILAILPIIDSLENVWDIMGDYRRPFWFCFTTELLYQNDSLRGFISGLAIAPPQFNTFVFHYDNFKNHWLAYNFSCMNIVGINENKIDKNNISVFPNPASSSIHISSTQEIQLAEMFSISGKLILQLLPVNNEIDIASLPCGMYFLKTTDTKGKTAFAKWVKQ